MDNKHIGSVEFGLTLDYFSDLYSSYFTDRMFAFHINHEATGAINIFKKYPKFQNGYVITNQSHFYQGALNGAKTTNEFDIFKHNNNSYTLLPSLKVYNYEKTEIGQLLVAFDITKQVDTNNSQIITILVFSSALLGGALLIGMNYGFNIYIKSINDFQNILHENNRILTEYADTIDAYIMSAETDTEGVITRVSSALCNLSGYDKAELIGNTHATIRHPDSQDELFKDLWSTIKKGGITGQAKSKTNEKTDRPTG